MESINVRKWRERAEEYRALADSMAHQGAKQSMLSMATTYDDMALQQEQKIGVPTIDYYLLRAQECRRLTLVARDAAARGLFEVLERRWLALARNRTLDRDGDSRA